MLSYLARRLVLAVLLVAAVSASALLLARLAPGDILSEQVGTGVSGRSLQAERARLGLDRPVIEQALDWAARAVRFDFGTSLMYGRPVAGLVAERARNTAILAVVALLLATCIGIPAGVVSGSRPGIAPAAIRAASVVALSLPSLVCSLLLVVVAARTGWLPTGGMSSPDAAGGGWLAGLIDLARHLVVPACAIAVPLAASIERLQSQATAEAMGETYITAAAARGVPRRRLVWRHALKPALRPVVSIYGLIFGSLLSGSFVVEIVTAWPGLGRLMFDALRFARRVSRRRLRSRRRRVPRGRRAAVRCAARADRSAVARPDGGRVVRRAGLALIAMVALAALAAPLLTPHGPAVRFDDRSFAPPMPIHVVGRDGRWHAPFVYPVRLADRLERRYDEDREHPVALAWFSEGVIVRLGDGRYGPWLPLGGDSVGRDVFARVLHGARLSLAVALIATLGALLIGVTVGGIAGVAGGLADDVLMRFSDFVLVLPAMYVVLSLRAALPLVLSTAQVFVLVAGILAVAGWPIVARGVRAIVAGERERDYAQAARALGMGPVRLLVRHLLPATTGFLATQATLVASAFILAEATLSYVGLGFPEPGGELGVDAAATPPTCRPSPMRRGRLRRRPPSSSSSSASTSSPSPAGPGK